MSFRAVASKPNPNSKPNFYRPLLSLFLHTHTHTLTQVGLVQKVKNQKKQKVKIHEIFKYSGEIGSKSNTVMVSDPRVATNLTHMTGEINLECTLMWSQF